MKRRDFLKKAACAAAALAVLPILAKRNSRVVAGIDFARGSDWATVTRATKVSNSEWKIDQVMVNIHTDEKLEMDEFCRRYFGTHQFRIGQIG